MRKKLKSLSDLAPSTTPVAEAPPAAHPSERYDLPRFLEAIETMRSSGSYDWADETLTGIYDAVEARGEYSLGQKRAVENILWSREKAAEELGLEF